MKHYKDWKEMRQIICEIDFEERELHIIRNLIEEYDNKLYLRSSLEKGLRQSQQILVKDFMKEAIAALARERGELRYFTNEWLQNQLEEAAYRFEYYANNTEAV